MDTPCPNCSGCRHSLTCPMVPAWLWGQSPLAKMDYLLLAAGLADQQRYLWEGR